MPEPPQPIATRIAGYRRSRDSIGESGSVVHRLHDRPGAPDLFLKYGEGALARALADEAARLRWFAPRLPVPQVVAVHAEGEAAWLLLSALPGRTAYQALAADPAGRDATVDALAAFLRRLHALPVADCPFDAGHRPRLAEAHARMTAGLVDTDDFDEVRQGWTAAQVWDAMTALLPFEADRVVTHGDFSLDNILIERGAITGCIDLARAGVADRHQDLAILCNSLAEFGPALPQRLLDRYGYVPDPRRMDFHLMLDEFF